MLTNSMSILSRGMMATIDANDNVAHNLANVNTSGYKKAHLIFKDIYDKTMVQAQNPLNVKDKTQREIGDISMGAKTQKIIYEFSQGTLQRTGRTLDVAIEGDGFFKLQEPDGKITYTRNGSFTIDNKNHLVTKDGAYVLDPLSKPVIVNVQDTELNHFSNIIIGEKGEIEIDTNSQRRVLQSIGIFDFSNKEDLKALGNSKFAPRNINLNPELRAEKYTIQQGAIEASNSNVVNEMVNMINVSRSYETMSKMMKQEGTLLTRAIELAKLKA